MLADADGRVGVLDPSWIPLRQEAMQRGSEGSEREPWRARTLIRQRSVECAQDKGWHGVHIVHLVAAIEGQVHLCAVLILVRIRRGHAVCIQGGHHRPTLMSSSEVGIRLSMDMCSCHNTSKSVGPSGRGRRKTLVRLKNWNRHSVEASKWQTRRHWQGRGWTEGCSPFTSDFVPSEFELACRV